MSGRRRVTTMKVPCSPPEIRLPAGHFSCRMPSDRIIAIAPSIRIPHRRQSALSLNTSHGPKPSLAHPASWARDCGTDMTSVHPVVSAMKFRARGVVRCKSDRAGLATSPRSPPTRARQRVGTMLTKASFGDVRRWSGGHARKPTTCSGGPSPAIECRCANTTAGCGR